MTTELSEEQARQNMERTEAEHQQYVGFKRDLELELSNLNVLVDGRRATGDEWNSWRQRKLKEKANIERHLVHLRKDKIQAHDAYEIFRRANYLATLPPRVVLNSPDDGSKDRLIAAVSLHNTTLTQHCADLERKNIALSAQLDIVIRKLNALNAVAAIGDRTR